MDIPDLTCTVLVRPYRWPWRIPHSYYTGSPLKKLKFQLTYFPGLYWLSRLGPKHSSPDENQWTYQTWPVQFLYGRTGDLEEFPIANIQESPLKKTQIPVNILPRTVRTSRLDQNVALRMRINGHTRLDLYSSCTAVQVTLKNSHSYTGSPLKKLKFQLTYFQDCTD